MEVDEEEVKEVPVVEINDSMSELEDGELEDDSDDDPMTSRAIRFGTTSSMSNDVLNTSREVLNKRAERFGLNTARKLPENPDIRKLHISMGVNNKTRTEALHLYGTDNMTTQDVFQYFDEPPASVEWLSNQTCNAVWLDEESCAKALLRHSIKIRGQPDSFDSDSEDEEYVNASDLRLTLPPGGAWRKGQTKSYAPNLLIRFANVNDKKELRPYVPESLKMKEKLFADGGDETVKKITTDDSGNPWSGLAQQWGSFERQSRNKFGGIQDARQLIKEKELRGSLIKNDARDLIKYNRICRLEKEGLDPEILAEYKKDQERNKYKRSLRLDDGPNRKRSRRSPGRDENLQIIVENDAYKPAKRPSRTRPTRPPRSTSSSSDSSSSSSGDSSSSSSDDSSSSSSSSEDEEDEPPKPPPQPSSLKAPWNKSSNKFKADSSLLIEIDNDLCRKKRHNE